MFWTTSIYCDPCIDSMFLRSLCLVLWDLLVLHIWWSPGGYLLSIHRYSRISQATAWHSIAEGYHGFRCRAESNRLKECTIEFEILFFVCVFLCVGCTFWLLWFVVYWPESRVVAVHGQDEYQSVPSHARSLTCKTALWSRFCISTVLQWKILASFYYSLI